MFNTYLQRDDATWIPGEWSVSREKIQSNLAQKCSGDAKCKNCCARTCWQNVHKARRFCSCLKSPRWGHLFIYLAGTIFLPEFYILIYKICTCYAMEYENIFNNCVQPIRFFGHGWTLFFCPRHIQTSPLPSTHTYMLWNIKYLIIVLSHARLTLLIAIAAS